MIVFTKAEGIKSGKGIGIIVHIIKHDLAVDTYTALDSLSIRSFMLVQKLQTIMPFHQNCEIVN